MAVLLLSSCSDFLDTMPDNRAEINTEAKITSLLVSAYPAAFPVMMAEMASDNAMDNGPLFSVEFQSQEDAYLWQDIVTDTDERSKTAIVAEYSIFIFFIFLRF